MNIRNNTAISFAIAAAVTVATATGLMTDASASYVAAEAQAASETATLQRLPTIVVMSEPEYQRMDAIVVTADPADYADSNDNAIANNDWIAPARTATTQLIRNASFDMPYYSFGTAKTLVVKE